jgi:hypothetical protein
MKSFLSSPIATSVSNIASVNIHKHSSFKTKKDYSDFISWLDTSNNDIKKIKLPSKKKLKDLEDLDFSSMLGGGNPLAALLGEILGGLAASLGIPSFNALPTFGKTTITPSTTPKAPVEIGTGVGGIPPISKVNPKDLTIKKVNVKVVNGTKLLPPKPNLLPESKIKGLLPSSESKAQIKLLPEKPKISQPGKGVGSSHPDIAGQEDFGKRADKILEERRAARSAKDATKVATKNIGKEAEKKAAKFAGKNAFGRFLKIAAPGAGSVFGAMDAKDRAEKGDKIGSWISGASSALSGFAAAAQIPAAAGLAIPGLGWAETAATELVAGSAEILSLGLDAVNLVRDLTGNSDVKKKEETSKNKIDIRLKEQEKKQREAASTSKVTFVSITDKFDKVVSKFGKIAGGMGYGTRSGQEDKMTPEEKEKAAHEAPEETPTPSTSLKGSPGHEFEPKMKQYITGDPSDRDYMADHGTETNYHDHLAFKDRDTAVKAFNFFKSKGIKVTEFKGYTPVGDHKGPDHYSGLAFDIPGYQWGGHGKIGPTEYQGSAKVRSGLNEFFNIKPSGKNDGSIGDMPSTNQQSIEDYAKQTMGKGADRILKDPKLKAQLLGEKNQFKNAMATTPVTDPEVKQLQKNYNVYVKGLRERRQSQIAPGQTPQVPEAIATPLQEQTGTTMIIQQPSSAPAGQSSMVPIPIPMGGDGGGVAVASIPEGQILNSLWKTMLLTNLSSA